MSAKLEIIAGPRKGELIQLEDQTFTIGRDPSNTLFILDSALSRHHCLIEWRNESYEIRDLKSRNGMLLNGTPLREKMLRDGDEIIIGESKFVFHFSSVGVHSSPDYASDPTIVLHKESAMYLNAATVLTSQPPTERAMRDLNALLQIGQAINSVHHIEELEQQILEAIFEVSEADRAAILFTNSRTGEIDAATNWDRYLGPLKSMQVSTTVVNRVIKDGVALVGNDLANDEALASSESLAVQQINNVLAVPIEFYGKMSGVIYLESANPQAKFDAPLLELMAAIGSMAAVAFENTRRIEWLEVENKRLKDESGIEHKMIGESSQMQAVYKFISKVAEQDTTVLVYGESGTGKELVARAIHENSTRKYKPCVAFNCAAISESLLESELFGHEKGAFTGAQSQKKGKFEFADGGTIFLDEVGELSTAMQAKLLRVLQEREFERVGGNKTIHTDVRVIAATNRDLKDMVKQGKFREDLYYRLNVVSIRMPALRERPDDIPLLATHFATKFAARTGHQIEGISPEALRYLLQYAWPGNVRELENALERAVVLSSGGTLYPEDLPENVLETAPPAEVANGSFHGELQGTKKQMVVRALDQSKGNVTEAAKILGVHPNYLHRLMNNLGIEKKRRGTSSSGG